MTAIKTKTKPPKKTKKTPTEKKKTNQKQNIKTWYFLVYLENQHCSTCLTDN